MNTKRQTVWLVSMLSLMVVLSAYYLFTDDVDQMNMTAEEQNLAEITATELGQDNAQAADETVSNEADSQTDEQVLQKVQAQENSGTDFFTSRQMQREVSLSESEDRLMTIITDSQQSTEAVTRAYEDLRIIQDKEAKITNLEEQLLNDYENAIISEEANKWKIIVQSDKLEKSQAVSIVDLVMKEMNATPDQIVIQYIQ